MIVFIGKELVQRSELMSFAVFGESHIEKSHNHTEELV